MRSVRSISPTRDNSLRARSRISTGTCTPQACHANGTAAPTKTEQSAGRGGPPATLLLSGAEGSERDADGSTARCWSRDKGSRVAVPDTRSCSPSPTESSACGPCRWRAESSQYARSSPTALQQPGR
jgi:hypothetical protein